MNLSYQCDMKDLCDSSGFRRIGRQERGDIALLAWILCYPAALYYAESTVVFTSPNWEPFQRNASGQHLPITLPRKELVSKGPIHKNEFHPLRLECHNFMWKKCGMRLFSQTKNAFLRLMEPPPCPICKQTPSDSVPEGALKLQAQ